MKKSIYLTSIGFKILSIGISLFLVSITVVLTMFNPLWYALLFLYLVTFMCIGGTVFCFINRIVLDISNNLISLYTFKRKRINLNDLFSVEVDTTNSTNSKKYCFIVFKMKDGTAIQMPGYSTLLRNKAVFYTQREINKLKKYLDI